MNTYVFSIFDILPYFFVFALLIIICNLKLPIKNKLFYCFFVTFLLAAIRYGVGYDYQNYADAVKDQQVGGSSFDRFEPLSQLMIIFARATHYQLFFVIGSFLTIYPIYRLCLKYSISPCTSFLVFYLHPMLYLNGLSVVRNAIAYSFVCYAFCILSEKKYFKSLLLIIVACLFHKAAFVGLLIYPIYFIKNSRILYISIYILSFLVASVLSALISNYSESLLLLSDAERYMNRESEGGGLMTIVVNGFCIVNFILWPQISRHSKDAARYLSIYCVGTFLWNVFLVFNITLATRLYLFYGYVIILIVPYYYLSLSSKIRPLAVRIVLAFFFLLFSSSFYINVSSFLEHPGKMSLIPYQTIFFGEDYSNLQE